MTCDNNCEPSKPCNANGCPNAATPPTDAADPSHMHDQPPTDSPPPAAQEPNPPPVSEAESSNPDGTVRIGVDNTSAGDINIEVNDNLVTGGRNRVHLGSGNHAAGANTGFISGNIADCDDLLIGVNNNSSGGNNDIQVNNNDFRGGFKSVRVGVGNHAGGSNRIVVGDTLPPSGRPSGPYDRTGGPSPPRPPSGPYEGQNNLAGGGGFGPGGPYYGGGAYYGGGIRDSRMWGYTGPPTNPGGMGYSRPPFGNPPPQ